VIKSYEFTIENADNLRLANLAGQFDEHLRLIERRLGVEINNRGGAFSVIGPVDLIESTADLLRELYALTDSEVLDGARINVLLQQAGLEDEISDILPDEVLVRTQRGIVRGRGRNQMLYLLNIRKHDLTFGIGRLVRAKPIWRWPVPSMRWSAMKCGALCWCGRRWRPASAWAFCLVTWLRRSIPICVPCTMHFMR